MMLAKNMLSNDSSSRDREQTPILFGAGDIPTDILLSIFEQLVGDSFTLSSIGLACHAFRELSFPCLLRDVDVSSHNNGQIPEQDCGTWSLCPVVYADYYGHCRPDSLMPRQHAFLRLILNQPRLAVYIQSFTWTLIWETVGEYRTEDGLPEFGPNSVEYETWTVFSQLINVTRLDLGSLHEVIDEPVARQDPPRLFSAVTDLRLLGWMHRGLVKAILTSLDPNRLQRLKLDCLMDDGAAADGSAIGGEFSHIYSPQHHGSESPIIIDDDLYQRQQNGGIFIFPGPMWFALRTLSTHQMTQLEHLEIKLPKFDSFADVRNYHTMFKETAGFILRVHDSLKTLIIARGEPLDYYDTTPRAGANNAHRLNWRSIHLRWDIRMSAYCLENIAAALGSVDFPRLTQLRFEGFHHIELAEEPQKSGAQLEKLRDSISAAKRNLDLDVNFTETTHLDYRIGAFYGYENAGCDADEWRDALLRS